MKHDTNLRKIRCIVFLIKKFRKNLDFSACYSVLPLKNKRDFDLQYTYLKSKIFYLKKFNKLKRFLEFSGFVVYVSKNPLISELRKIQ